VESQTFLTLVDLCKSDHVRVRITAKESYGIVLGVKNGPIARNVTLFGGVC
jgi:hypothetical protein